MIPILVWLVVVGMGGIAFFGKSIVDVVGYAFCQLPIISGFQSCQPTLIDYVMTFMPWAFLFFVVGLGYLIILKRGKLW